MKYLELFAGVGGFRLAIEKVYVENNQEETKRLRQKSEEGLRVGETKRETVENERLADSQSGMEQQSNRSSDRQPTCIGYSEIDKYAISVYDYQFPNTKNYGDISKIDWNTVPDFDLVVGGSPCQDLSVAGKQKGLSGARSGLFFEFVRCLKEKQPTNFIWENVKGALSSSSGWDFGRVQIEFSEAGYDCEWQVLNAKDFGVPQNRERIFVVGHLRGKSEPKVFPIRTVYELSNGQDESDKRRTQTKLSATLRRNPAKKADDTYIESESKIRRLTPLECERLMSWPDNWTKYGYDKDKFADVEISDTQRYKMCGNGVVSKVVEAIVEKLWKNTSNH